MNKLRTKYGDVSYKFITQQMYHSYEVSITLTVNMGHINELNITQSCSDREYIEYEKLIYQNMLEQMRSFINQFKEEYYCINGILYSVNNVSLEKFMDYCLEKYKNEV